MRILIITQNEPFYLTKSLKYLLTILPDSSELIGCVVTDVSPFGKKESFFTKAKKTYQIFGWIFFVYYSFKYLKSKCSSNNNIFKFLKSNSIPIILLDESINNPKSLVQDQWRGQNLLGKVLMRVRDTIQNSE